MSISFVAVGLFITNVISRQMIPYNEDPISYSSTVAFFIDGNGVLECDEGYSIVSLYRDECDDISCIRLFKCARPSINMVSDSECVWDVHLTNDDDRECPTGSFISGINATNEIISEIKCCEYIPINNYVEFIYYDDVITWTTCFGSNNTWCNVDNNEFLMGWSGMITALSDFGSVLQSSIYFETSSPTKFSYFNVQYIIYLHL